MSKFIFKLFISTTLLLGTPSSFGVTGSENLYMYPEVLEQDVKLNLFVRSAFVGVDLAIAATWAAFAGLAASWDPYIVSTTFIGDASLGFLAIPVYSTGLIKGLAVYKKRQELQSLAGFDGSKSLHIYTGGPTEYTHLFRLPYIAKWMKTRSLVFLSGTDELKNSVRTHDKDLIEIEDLNNSYLELQLKIQNKSTNLNKVKIPLVDFLNGYKLPPSTQSEWALAVENTNINKNSDSNFSIESTLKVPKTKLTHI